MTLHNFLTRLLQEGRLLTEVNAHKVLPADADSAAAATFLQTQYDEILGDAPADYPPLDVEIALVAAEAFAWFAAVMNDRSTVVDSLPKSWAKRWVRLTRVSEDCSHHASVDLVFRFAPDCILRLRGNAADEELLELWRPFLEPWPLACVGTPIENPAAAKRVITACPPLATTMADRIVIRQDNARRNDPVYGRWIANAIGDYRELDFQPSSDSDS